MERREEDLKVLCEWLKKQAHLPKIDGRMVFLVFGKELFKLFLQKSACFCSCKAAILAMRGRRKPSTRFSRSKRILQKFSECETLGVL